MTLEVIESQLKKFLESDIPQVIAIRGNWGVGKTFLWRKMYDEAREKKALAFTTQSYVSLFGINSVDDLKVEIFTLIIEVMRIYLIFLNMPLQEKWMIRKL